MDKDILKSALFGYSKMSVCRYIATMNEEFNAKLMAETDSFRSERTKLQQRIDELEAELAGYKGNMCDVSTMLQETGQYVDQLRQKTQEEADELLRQAKQEADQLRERTQKEADRLLLEIKTKGQVQTQKIELYTEAIVKLRENLAMLTSCTDDALNTFSEQFLSLRKGFEDSEL